MTKKPARHGQDNIDEALKALLETQPEAEPSLLDQVAKHFALIEQLRECGHSYGRIAEALRQGDMDIAENTLRLYMGRLRRRASGVRISNAKPASKGTVRAEPAVMRVEPTTPAAGQATRKVDEIASWLTDAPDETKI